MTKQDFAAKCAGSGAVNTKYTGLYIHIPFCVQKCNYCAFLSFKGDEDIRREYAVALGAELKMRAEIIKDAGAAGRPLINSVYFGGGTPSLMDLSVMAELMAVIRENYETAPDAEITLEANPGTLGGDDGAVLARLRSYRNMGINRLSMGVQSTDDDMLRRLGRIHTADDAVRDVRLAREAGFDNISLDLIFSVPGETEADALRDAANVIALSPEHISCYSMQLEEGTVFYEMAERGELKEVPDEEDRKTYHSLCRLLRDAGFEHYEISNFARTKSCRSRHNSCYWDMSDYIGCGLGASGFTGGIRYRNTTELKEYLDYYSRGGRDMPLCEFHINTPFDNISEAVFTGLRRMEGITYEDAAAAYDRGRSGAYCAGSTDADAEDAYTRFWTIYADAKKEAQEYAERGLLVIDSRGIRLTEEGIDISNSIMSLFV